MPVNSFGPTTLPRSRRDARCARRRPGWSTPSNRDGSSASCASSGWMLRHTVRHVVPSWRARPWTEACSGRSCPIAHQHARIVNKPRGAADPLVLLGERSAGTDSFAAPPGPFPPQHLNRPTETRRIDQHHVRRPPLAAITPHTGNPLATAATPPSRSNDQRRRRP